MAISQTVIDQYDRLIEAVPEIERKGKNMLYTSANGYMFSQISREGFVGIRLPKEEQELFIEKFNTVLFKSYGAVMKDYVQIPSGLLDDTELLKVYLKMGYDYVMSLKPKPTKK